MPPTDERSAVPAPPPVPRAETPSAAPDPASGGVVEQAGVRPNPLRPQPAAPRYGAQVRPGPIVTPTPEPSAAQTPPGAKPFGKGKHSGIPFDPIKENGRFFVGWPKPRVALVITGRIDGYMEPCGCAGKERMKGGLSRRHAMIQQLRGQGWPLVLVDVGGLSKGFGIQPELKFSYTADALRKIGYDAVTLGQNDLRLPAATLLLAVASADSKQPSPFVSANVGLFGFANDEYTSRKRIVEAGGKKVAITAILGKKYQQEINNPDIEIADPAEALAKLVPAMKQEADVLVLLAHAPDDEAIELARRFPEFAVVVTSAGPAEPPGQAETVPGAKTILVHVGEKGMSAVVLGLFDDARQPIRYQRVILDSRYPDSPEMKRVMTDYQDELRTRGLEGLEIRPVPHPQKELLGRYIGSEKCKDCHEGSYDMWKKTGHAKAWRTLVDLDPPRNFDPECISCHVVGWHPKNYVPYESGFMSQEKTPALVNVGCETCHGPGEAHTNAEMGANVELQKKLQEAVRVTKEQSEKSDVHNCRNCHDLDNSPDFDFPSYWPQVEHHDE